MRTRLSHLIALAGMIACLPGCSIFIDSSGITLRDLDSRQIVHDRFGPPDSVSLVDLIDPASEEVCQFEVEHHHINAKVNTSMPIGAWFPFMLVVEPYLTCRAIYDAAEEYVEGHDLSFVYDQQGNTIGHDYPRPYLDALTAGKNNVLRWKPVASP